jgi:hypothetical protein
MVAGQLVKCLLAPEITATVTCPQAERPVCTCQKDNPGAADWTGWLALHLGPVLRPPAVDLLQGLTPPPLVLVDISSQLKCAQCVDYQAAGECAVAVTAHTVSDRPEPVVLKGQNGIFIVSTLIAWIGLRAA